MYVHIYLLFFFFFLELRTRMLPLFSARISVLLHDSPPPSVNQVDYLLCVCYIGDKLE